MCLAGLFRYQEYVKIDNVQDVHKLPDSIPMEVACILGCSALTAYSAVVKMKAAVEAGVSFRGGHSPRFMFKEDLKDNYSHRACLGN